MLNSLVILSGKLLSLITKKLNLGNGSTWPGHIALKLNRNFINDILKNSNIKVIIVAGTNGKTTTSKLLSTIIESNEKTVILNSSGANLLNGIASSLLLHSGVFSAPKQDYAIFETDENALPLILNEITPDYLIILNLFRDQLDRYGEVNIIADTWKNSISKLSEKTTLILNADDPQIAFLGINIDSLVKYFDCGDVLIHGDKHVQEYALDSVYCPKCGNKLFFKKVTFSHLGDWRCKECGLKKPDTIFNKSPFYPLLGVYNKYNTNAAVLIANQEKIKKDTIKSALINFKPAFGRQEEIIIGDKKVKIFLSKNPTGFNESLRTAKSLGAKTVLFILNDRIPDGRDVSWIWDTDIEGILDFKETIILSGDRVFDLGLRLKYAIPLKFQISNFKFQIEENLEKAIYLGLQKTPPNEILYIIPTYTAMLEVRKILIGKKIL